MTSRTVGEGLAVDPNSDRPLLQHHASNNGNSDNNNIHVNVSDLMWRVRTFSSWTRAASSVSLDQSLAEPGPGLY